MAEYASWDFEEGEEIGPGRSVLKAIGGGNRYEVCLVWDQSLYALGVAKVLRPDQAEEEKALRDLALEADALTALAHPTLVRCFDAVLGGPRPHLLLEHLDGPSLRPAAARVFGSLQADEALLPGHASAVRRSGALALALLVLAATPLFLAANAAGVIGDLPAAIAKGSNSGPGGGDDDGDSSGPGGGGDDDDDDTGTHTRTGANRAEATDDTSANGHSTRGTTDDNDTNTRLGTDDTSRNGDSTRGTTDDNDTHTGTGTHTRTQGQTQTRTGS